MSKKSQQAMFDAAYNIKQIKKIEQLEADNTKLVEVSARLLNENAKLRAMVEAVQGVLASECPSQVAGNVDVEYYWMRKLESALAALEGDAGK